MTVIASASLSRTAGWWRWCATLACVRLPAAMAPLALVLAGRHATGSFAFGGLLAASHALAEAAFAAPSGRLLDRAGARGAGPVRAALVAMLIVEAAAFAALAAGIAAGAPGGVLLALAAVAAGAAAGVPGALRAQLGPLVGADRVQRALAVDAVLLELVWMGAPLAAAGLAGLWAPEAAVGAMAGAGLAAAALAALSRAPRARAPVRTGSRPRLTRATATLLLTTAAMGYAEGTIGVALPPRLEELGSEPALAGLLLALVSAASVAGGLLYGRLQHRWRLDPYRRSDVLLAALALGVLAAGQAPSIALLALVLLLTGLVIAPLNAARSYAMELASPAGREVESFSLMYAAMGGGWGLSGLGVGLLLGAAGAGGPLTLAGLLALAAAFARGPAPAPGAGAASPAPASRGTGTARRSGPSG